MEDEYRLRQKRIFDLMRSGQPSPSTTPGFAGGTLPSINPAHIGPAPIGDPDTPPVKGTPQWDQAMSHAYPVSASGQSQQQPPSRLTYGNRGFSGDDSLVKLRSLRNSPLPEYGRAKGAGYGALAGIAANQNGTLGEKLGGGLAGLITGGIRPNIAASLKRDYEIKQAEAQAKQDQSLAQEAAQTDQILAQPEIQRQRIEQQRQEAEAQAAYRNQQLEEQRARNQAVVDRANADREARKAQADADRTEREKARIETERHHREDEQLRGRHEPKDTRGKYQGAKGEYDSLIEEEKAAGEEKDRAYKVLADLKSSTGPVTDPKTGKTTVGPNVSGADIAQAEKEAQDANSYYRSFADKKRKAQSAMSENAPEVNTDLMPKGKYAGRTISLKSLRAYANANGLTPQQAKDFFEKEGASVVR